MAQHLFREIEKLKKQILSLGSIVEERLYNAVKAVDERDEGLAQDVANGDKVVDLMEVEIEEDCLKVLALYQPVAVDLRFIIAVLKINNDLERIGDLAVGISRRALKLAKLKRIDTRFDFDEMTDSVKLMLRKSLQALVTLDPELAREVCDADDKVDQLNRDIYMSAKDAIHENPEENEALLNLISVARGLERIADHTTNIAEDVLYMIDGQIHRHWYKEKDKHS